MKKFLKYITVVLVLTLALSSMVFGSDDDPYNSRSMVKPAATITVTDN